MPFSIRLGIPEMLELWQKLKSDNDSGKISQKDSQLYKKLGKTFKLLSNNPSHPSLNTHEIPKLTRRYKKKVWQSYIENRKSRAMRIYWVYGPNKKDITIIGLEPHPEDTKNRAYDKIKLSDMP